MNSFLLLALGAFVAASPARAELGIHGAAQFGIGAMGTDNPANPSRSVGTFGIQGMPGWRLPNKIMPGLLIDYRFHTQLEEKSGTGSHDYAGQSLTFGLGAEFEGGPVKLLAAYDPVARHWMASPVATLKGSGFHLLVAYEFESHWYLDLAYSQASYDEAGINGLNQHQRYPIVHWNLALGMSCAY